MNREKKIKLFLGSAYILIVSVFLLIFFNNFSFQDFSSYELIRENREALENIKNSNIFLSSIIFLIGTIVWVLLLGFGSPVFLVGGFIFGLPTIFNVKVRNFFLGSIIGMTPQLFVGASLGAGLSKILEENSEVPSVLELIFSPDIYLPILGIIVLVIIGFFLKKNFYTK